MEEKSRNYVSGIIGAFVGGLIAAVPWIILYVFLNMITSIAAILIGMGAYAGYKKLKGPQTKAAVWIIIVVSLIVVTLTNFVIIPFVYLAKDGYPVSMRYYKWFFTSKDLVASMIKDYLFSIVFTFFGIQGVVRTIKNEVDPEYVNNDVMNHQDNEEISSKIKRVFVNYNALDKHNSIKKEMILNEVGSAQAKDEFQRLYVQKLIRSYHGKYYYDQRCEQDQAYRRKVIMFYTLKVFGIAFGVMIALLLLAVVIGVILS